MDSKKLSRLEVANQQSSRAEYEVRNQEMQKIAVLELERLRVERTKI